MYCLELWVNDKRVAIVGRENSQNYHATVTYWGRRDAVEVSANGSSDVKNNISETYTWGKQNLASDDVVTIKVIDCKNPDSPIEVNKHDHTEDMDELEAKIVEMTAKYRVKAELEGKASILESDVPEGIYCSFCGKAKDKVEKMISGPSVFICSECVDVCNSIVKGEEYEPKWPERE
jgi:hypothetical protein